MRALLTGAGGYLGSALRRRLTHAAFDVTALDSGLFEAADAVPDAALVRKDIRDLELADVRGAGAVVHLAELSNDPCADLNPHLTWDVNHRGTIRLARLAKAAGVQRFVYYSSCSVYGVTGDRIATEATTPRPLTTYARCKLLVERDLLRLLDPTFSVTILRNATAFGPSPAPRLDLVVNDLTASALRHGELRLQSDGSAWRPFVHVEDICDATLAILEAESRVHGRTFNVGSDALNLRIRDVADTVHRCFPDATLSVGATTDARHYRVSFRALHATFPKLHEPRTIEDGVRDVRGMLGGFSDAELQPARRIEHLRRLVAEGRVDPTLRWAAPQAA
jgi:nucleoside-diphosphate-sugar epimerase